MSQPQARNARFQLTTDGKSAIRSSIRDAIQASLEPTGKLVQKQQADLLKLTKSLEELLSLLENTSKSDNYINKFAALAVKDMAIAQAENARAQARDDSSATSPKKPSRKSPARVAPRDRDVAPDDEEEEEEDNESDGGDSERKGKGPRVSAKAKARRAASKGSSGIYSLSKGQGGQHKTVWERWSHDDFSNMDKLLRPLFQIKASKSSIDTGVPFRVVWMILGNPTPREDPRRTTSWLKPHDLGTELYDLQRVLAKIHGGNANPGILMLYPQFFSMTGQSMLDQRDHPLQTAATELATRSRASTSAFGSSSSSSSSSSGLSLDLYHCMPLPVAIDTATTTAAPPGAAGLAGHSILLPGLARDSLYDRIFQCMTNIVDELRRPAHLPANKRYGLIVIPCWRRDNSSSYVDSRAYADSVAQQDELIHWFYAADLEFEDVVRHPVHQVEVRAIRHFLNELERWCVSDPWYQYAETTFHA